MAKRRPIDWEAIEREYRAGQLSVLEIGRQNGVSHTAINKRAKAHSWKRDLAARVRAEVSAKLVSEEVSAEVSNANAQAIVETAAARGVEVVRQHRGDIARLRRIGGVLADRLERLLAGEAITGVAIGDKESASDMLEKLSRVSTRVVQLERQAFSLDQNSEPESAVDATVRERIASRILGLAARSAADGDPGGTDEQRSG